jgi:hypothetical protein
MDCINRDINACYNIRKITEAALIGEPRPQAFLRQNATIYISDLFFQNSSSGGRCQMALGQLLQAV